MPIVHHEVTETCQRLGKPAASQGLIDRQNAIWNMNPYDPVERGDRSVSFSTRLASPGNKAQDLATPQPM
jgi:hypothetical protein